MVRLRVSCKMRGRRASRLCDTPVANTRPQRRTAAKGQQRLLCQLQGDIRLVLPARRQLTRLAPPPQPFQLPLLQLQELPGPV